MICICILCIPILERASHFGYYEQGSHEIFQDTICSHTWINIFSYITLLFITAKKFEFVLTKYLGYGYNNLCLMHMIQYFLDIRVCPVEPQLLQILISRKWTDIPVSRRNTAPQ